MKTGLLKRLLQKNRAAELVKHEHERPKFQLNRGANPAKSAPGKLEVIVCWLLHQEAGDKGAGRPFPLHPKSPPKAASASLRITPNRRWKQLRDRHIQLAGKSVPGATRTGFRLTIPNTSPTINKPASLRSDRCSPRTGTPFGFLPEPAFTFTGIPT